MSRLRFIYSMQRKKLGNRKIQHHAHEYTGRDEISTSGIPVHMLSVVRLPWAGLIFLVFL